MSSSECAPPSVPSKTKSIDGGSALHINLRVAANCGVLHQGPALVCQKSLFSDISVCLCRVWGVWVLSTAILPCWPHLPLMRFWKPIKGHHCLLFWLRQKWAVRSIRQTLSSWPGNTTICPEEPPVGRGSAVLHTTLCPNVVTRNLASALPPTRGGADLWELGRGKAQFCYLFHSFRCISTFPVRSKVRQRYESKDGRRWGRKRRDFKSYSNLDIYSRHWKCFAVWLRIEIFQEDPEVQISIFETSKCNVKESWLNFYVYKIFLRLRINSRQKYFQISARFHEDFVKLWRRYKPECYESGASLQTCEQCYSCMGTLRRFIKEN